jgi:beta-glucosidase/6-phospho-beta-glucosidase/beta-galactosidase
LTAGPRRLTIARLSAADQPGPEGRFPAGFLWGAATSALQIEGASEADGRGPSVWDAFCREQPERIHDRASPELACDHYRRWREDVDWMRRLGLTAYRFSIAWPRVVADGTGAVNAAGLDFYDRLVDALGEAGIEPCVTLYHWDLPLALGRAGGWEAPATIAAFLRFVEACAARLGDRVRLWCTLNEPAWSTLHGYVTGLHPPARHDYAAAVRVAHHLMLAHARATPVLRAAAPGARVGVALNLSPVLPAGPSEADAAAARLADGVLHRFFGDAAVLGRYPADVLEFYASRGLLPAMPAAELAVLARACVDFVGVNYYYPLHATANAPQTRFHLDTSGASRPGDAGLLSIRGLFRLVRNPGGRHTAWGWEIDPDGLRQALMSIHGLRPGLPVYVTENGLGLDERPEGGRIEDPERIAYLRSHLEAVGTALRAGVDVRGYFVWSLMDNFSWLNGYKKRYGLLHVDRRTLARTPKASADWYRAVAAG